MSVRVSLLGILLVFVSTEPVLAQIQPSFVDAPETPGVPFAEVDCHSMESDQDAKMPLGFHQGDLSLQGLVGVLYSTELGPGIPEIDMLSMKGRLGYMLTSPTTSFGIFDGNWEALLEYNVAPVSDSFASIVTGPSVLMRYNNVGPGRAWVPYLQLGGGLCYSDGYKNLGQRALGQAVEFYLQGGAGLRFLMTPNWSIDLEVSYVHISDGGMSERNAGINSLGSLLGFTFTFPAGHPH